MISIPYIYRRAASDEPEERTVLVREDGICQIRDCDYRPGYTLVSLDGSDKPLLCPMTMLDWHEALAALTAEQEEEEPCNPGA